MKIQIKYATGESTRFGYREYKKIRTETDRLAKLVEIIFEDNPQLQNIHIKRME